MTAHQAPPSLGFSRQEHWSGLPFPSPVHESEKLKWSRSVVSNSSRPHGLQPTRLLHPWDFPGKSTGVGCHCLLHYIVRQGYMIRIKAVTVLHSSARFQEGRFVCRVFSGKCSGFLILMSLSGSLILPQMVHWLLFLWLAIVLVCETQRRSWRLESCLQGVGDKKSSVPRSPTGPCVASVIFKKYKICCGGSSPLTI